MIYFYSWQSYLIIIPALLLTFYASFKVRVTFNKYKNIHSRSDWTASDMSRMLLERYDVRGVSVNRIKGNLTDNFNPTDNTLYLSDTVYSSNSIAALGVAAHEVGHAVQHKEEYFPLKLRSLLVPVTNVGSMISIPLLILGVLIEFIAKSQILGSFGSVLVLAGIIAYGLSMVFALATLPVELNASHRAAKMLLDTGVLNKSEIKDAKKVLNAAAFTYIASFMLSLMYFLRLLMILSQIRRR